MSGARDTNGEKRNVYRLLAGKPEGKRPLGRSRRRRIDNNKMDLSHFRLFSKAVLSSGIVGVYQTVGRK
jgi:hypothetical protein